MKKSFYLVAVLCLLGNVAYAFDVAKIADVLKHSSISVVTQTAWQTILDAEINKKPNKTLRVIRSITEINDDRHSLYGNTDPDVPNKLKELKDAEANYNKKAASFAGFQRALANAYRHKLSPNKIIEAFVEVFYE